MENPYLEIASKRKYDREKLIRAAEKIQEACRAAVSCEECCLWNETCPFFTYLPASWKIRREENK